VGGLGFRVTSLFGGRIRPHGHFRDTNTLDRALVWSGTQFRTRGPKSSTGSYVLGACSPDIPVRSYPLYYTHMETLHGAINQLSNLLLPCTLTTGVTQN
jgi:hypothetical protein